MELFAAGAVESVGTVCEDEEAAGGIGDHHDGVIGHLVTGSEMFLEIGEEVVSVESFVVGDGIRVPGKSEDDRDPANDIGMRSAHLRKALVKLIGDAGLEQVDVDVELAIAASEFGIDGEGDFGIGRGAAIGSGDAAARVPGFLEIIRFIALFDVGVFHAPAASRGHQEKLGFATPVFEDGVAGGGVNESALRREVRVGDATRDDREKDGVWGGGGGGLGGKVKNEGEE